MNVRDVDFDTIRIRDLQGRYYREHQALIQWGRWSGDRRGVFPKAAGCTLGAHYKAAPGDFAEPDKDKPERAPLLEPNRSQPRERLPYDEKTALLLDERLHCGEVGLEVRVCLRTAYVTREVPEAQFHRFSNCSTVDQFCERLETALRFVARFI